VVADLEFLRAVEAAERFADGACLADELRARDYDLWDLVRDNRYGYHKRNLPAGVDHALLALTAIDGSAEWAGRVKASAVRPLVRCIFGNPVRTYVLDPACLTVTVQGIAHAAYADRIMPRGDLDTVRLAVLADALEEAGVAGEVLDHLRGPARHVRGCWAVDACLQCAPG
jgi:hypothetical protein